MSVHVGQSCVIHPSAKVADDVVVGPYTVIEANAEVGAGTVIGNSVTIGPHTKIGERNRIYSHVVLGSDPQDLTYKGEDTRLEIGDGNTFREFFTVNRGTLKGDRLTTIGDNGLFMSCSHVAHDCHVGNNVVMGNCALLGGHIHVGDNVVLSGGAAFHHFVTIGRFAFVGGLTRVVQDVPPYMIVEGNPSKVRGVNAVGLRRGGFSEDVTEALRSAYAILYKNGLTKAEAIEQIQSGPKRCEEVEHLVGFLSNMLRAKHGRVLQP